MDIVILTDHRYVNPLEINDYNKNVLLEDELVSKALQKEGFKTTRVAWSDPEFDWSSTRYILFRSTWDYCDRFDEFSRWLNLVSQQTILLNSEGLVRWNLNKYYLKDLESKGVHCSPTIFINANEQTSLKHLYEIYGLDETVLKPAISGGARHTYRLQKNTFQEYEATFQELLLTESMLLQPFQYNIVTQGEISMVLIDGRYTHAVLKLAKEGDFRVQDDFGGTVHQYNATKEEIAFAEKAINACSPKPIYARVDIFKDNEGMIALAELELIEPELWFRNNPSAADKLAKAIKKL